MSSIKQPRLPQFLIIGAMKAATTTIYEQLRMLDGIYMPALKEPNFFSDDINYQRGMDWYRKLFDSAEDTDILGEASTHYAKLPTYPNSLSRIYQTLPDVKLIYIMRDPIDRLISQYIHEWSCNNIREDINNAINIHEDLIKYSCYAYQLAPYLNRYGYKNILPVFFERLKNEPEEQLTRIARFIGYSGDVKWREDSAKTNVSSERLRTNAALNSMLNNPLLTVLRRTLVPRSLRDIVKSKIRMTERPKLSEESKQKLEEIFDADMKNLGRHLGIDLSTRNYREQVANRTLEWSIKTKYERAANIYEYE